MTIPGLGPVQRAVLDELERHGTINAAEAGAVAHGARGKHRPDEFCKWCAVDGRPILQSLINRGVAEKGPEGTVQLPRPQERLQGPGDFPEGFGSEPARRDQGDGLQGVASGDAS